MDAAAAEPEKPPMGVREEALDGDTQIGAVGKDPEVRAAHRKTGLFVFFKDARNALKLDEMGVEIAGIAVPAALALAADPLASLVDTAFIGQIGPVELAAVGVSIAVFNQISKVAIYPIVSVTTSFVAEEHAARQEKASSAAATAAAADAEDPSGDCGTSPVGGRRRQFIPSVSSALVVGAVLGLLQALLLGLAAKPFHFCSVHVSGFHPSIVSIHEPSAYNYLTCRVKRTKLSVETITASPQTYVFRRINDKEREPTKVVAEEEDHTLT